jgi:hypothetical protein
MIIAAKSVYFLSTPPQKCLFPVQLSDESQLRWRRSSVTGGKTVAHTSKGWRARSSHTGCAGRPQRGAPVQRQGQQAGLGHDSVGGR